MYFHGLTGSDEWNSLKAACCPNSCAETCDWYSHLKMLKGPAVDGIDWRSDGSLCSNLTYRASETLLWSTLNDPYGIYNVCLPITVEYFISFFAGLLPNSDAKYGNGKIAWLLAASSKRNSILRQSSLSTLQSRLNRQQQWIQLLGRCFTQLLAQQS